MKIYIGNLPYSVTESELEEAFAAFGEVSSVSVITDRVSGKPKGFAFVEMPETSAAEAAINTLNETDLKGRTIKVSPAKPKRERPQRGPRQ
ncbi:MAG: RNA-binding protein [Proteobacteria bacterium]|nr:RNA-binding protein [Pseudomonadota bacterium]